MKNKGCDWTNELSKLLHHLEECEFFPVACPLGCRDEIGEVNRVERRGVETHRTCCSMGTVKCDYCGRKVKACKISPHLVLCEEFPILCPNECKDAAGLKRKDESIHLSQYCPLQDIVCPFSQYGCEVKAQRRLMIQHEKKDMDSHLRLTMDNMQSKLTKLEFKMDNTQSKLTKLEFTMDNTQSKLAKLESTMDNMQSKVVKLKEKNARFEKKMVKKENKKLRKIDLKIQSIISTLSRVELRGNLEWKISGVRDKISQKENTYSDPFYVGLYKFQGRVDWNEKDNHIGLFIFIMKGKSDELLKWPIKYLYSIVLINQQLDANNDHRREFEIKDNILEEEPTCFEKPKSFRNDKGYGFPQYMSQADIIKEKYCKDDSIELNISVELI